MELTFRFKSQTDHRCSIISDRPVTSTLWITSQYQNLVWALGKSMFCACAVLSSITYLAVQCVSTLFHKRHDSRGEKIIGNEICVLIFSITFVWNISHSPKNWARYDQKCILGFFCCSLDRAFSIWKTKINQQNAQINSGLIYYWSITPNMFRPLSRSHHQGVRNPWEL